MKFYNCYCNACGQVGHEQKGVLTLADRKALQELNNVSERLMDVQGRLELPAGTTFNHDEFPREARMWLFKGGLTPTTWTKYRIGYNANIKRVILPVYNDTGDLVWFQCRAVFAGQKPKYIQPSRDKSSIVFAAGNTEARGRVVVVEDIMSAIRVGEAVCGNILDTRAISLLGTKLQSGQAAYLSEFTKLTTWLDSDKAGRNGASTVRRTMGLVCETSNIVTEEDPKCYSNKQIKEIIGV